MKLVVLGIEPIETLKQMVIDKFSLIKNTEIEIPNFSQFQNPLSSPYISRQISTVCLKSTNYIILSFPLPSLRKHLKCNPCHYYAHLIGHECQNSLLSLLKLKGFAHALSTSGDYCRHWGVFRLRVEVSENGLQNYEEIVRICFEYIDLVKSEKRKWVYDECKLLNEMEFMYLDKIQSSTYCSQLAGKMQEYDVNDCIKGEYLMDKYDEDVIAMVGSYLTKDNFRIMIVSNSFVSNEWIKSQYYNTPYKVEEFSQKFKDVKFF
jgi:insulysin